ncbi:MAG TPA: YidC/Oxa1 family membrane protein insertase [Candidatus Limnocylindria bacterium]|jgi:YidC/Oxa1 family membrane protein insertase|nr:YidC/Oxa1 family membrane protein insertase [Candidatus Limnocylindria bacterium]
MFDFLLPLWNNLLVHPLISLLVLAYNIVPDFGVAVILVTVAIRLALYPLFRAQVRSSRAMQELAPALAEIKKKVGNDRARLQQEQMKLYQERGINPLAGCLPMLIFFPVLFAMYAAFQQVGGLGVPALTGQQLRDNVLFRLPWSSEPLIPLPAGVGPDDHLDLAAHWLPWIGTLAHPDHLFFGWIGPLPIVSAILQLIASIQALPRNPPKTDDPTQRTMQQMTYYLPLITILFFKDLAAGVFIYYITTTIFQIVQQYFVLGWGQLARWVPALDRFPTPADREMRRREQAAVAEAQEDLKVAAVVARRDANANGGRRRGRRRRR